MSYVPPPQPPMKPQGDNTGAVVAAAGVGTGMIAVIVLAAVAVVFFALCVIGVLALLLLPAINAAREAARRNGSLNNVRQITIAMLNYESTNAGFPPQYSVDGAGQPLHSWRTLLLPYMEQSGLYQQIDQNQPWDSDANIVAAETEVSLFKSPRYDDEGPVTNYVAIAGEGFLFNGDQRVRMADLQDGTSNTMILIEIANSDIQWAEPRDLTLDQVQFEDAGAGDDATNVVRSMAVIGFADGHVMVNQTSDVEELRKLLTISGAEAVTAW